MSSNDRNSRTRFSNRVENYRRYRPGYPEELFEDIIDGFSLIGSPVADIGSGTGIFSRPLLERECSVYGVEPNADMRAAAETWLGDSPGFTSVDGDAGASSLSDDSVSAIFCAQSFHWFDPAAAGRELQAELLDLFDRYNDGMRIRFEYITETYIGRWQ